MSGLARRRLTRRRALVTAVVVAAGLAASAAGTVAAGEAPGVLSRAVVQVPQGAPAPAGPPGEALQIVVMPHPDDEIEAWSLVAHRRDLYTVFVLASRGEHSRHCRMSAGRLARLALLGERIPRPVPLGLGAAGCARARLDAWNAFLDAGGRHDPALATGRLHVVRLRPGPTHGLAAPRPSAGDVLAEVGTHGARIAFDLGDGRLTADGVRWAVWTTLGLSGSVLPALPVDRIVGAAYYNDPRLSAPGGDPRSTCPLCDASPLDTPYPHPDHGAVQTALRTTWFGAPAYVVTGPHDPLATVRTALSERDYAALMGPAGAQRPAGLVQEVYGWLKAPPGWPAGTEADGRSFMTRVDHFVVVGPPPDARP